MSIAFDDTSQTIWVTGKPLRFGDKHFPSPTELVIGRAPRDVTLTRRATRKQGVDIPDLPDPPHIPKWGEAIDCLKDLMECGPNLVGALDADLESPEKHISLDSKNNEPHKKYWPPE